MITDIFARRYADTPIRKQYFQEDMRFMNQAAVMLMDPLWVGFRSDKPAKVTEDALKRVHDDLALELGREYLSDRFWFQKTSFNGNNSTTAHTNSYPTICKNFLVAIPKDVTQGDAWVKERLSLVELAFRYRWHQVLYANRQLPELIEKAEAYDRRPAAGIRLPGRQVDSVRVINDNMNAAFNSLVHDLNERLRQANYGLVYNNGMIHFENDQIVAEQISKPFWALVADPIWKNVDEQMKEAIDRRDRLDRTASFHAVCALESTIKIISDVKNWTTGNEKGAANYIDNLVSKKNGRFIEVWEGQMLKGMFSDVRNPFAHGPGQQPMPKLTIEQTDWSIETSMSWINSLIRRV